METEQVPMLLWSNVQAVEPLVSTAADGSCGVEYSFALAGVYELEVAYGDASLGVYTIDVVPEAGEADGQGQPT